MFFLGDARQDALLGPSWRRDLPGGQNQNPPHCSRLAEQALALMAACQMRFHFQRGEA